MKNQNQPLLPHREDRSGDFEWTAEIININPKHSKLRLSFTQEYFIFTGFLL